MATYAHLSGGGQYGVTITAAGSTNTKGSYTELSASTPFDSSRLYFQTIFITLSTPARRMLTDIATGAGGAEVVRVADILATGGNDAGGVSPGCHELNLDIASGTRIACRTQCNVASGSITVAIMLEDRALKSLGATATYGANTGDSGGTSIDPGGSANTKGAYSQLTASTSATHKAFTIITFLDANTTPTFCQWNLDIATGAGGAEIVVIPDLPYQSADLGSDFMGPATRTLDLEVTSGTRIAARAACTITDATDRLFDLVLIGQDLPAAMTSAGGSFAFA